MDLLLLVIYDDAAADVTLALDAERRLLKGHADSMVACGHPVQHVEVRSSRRTGCSDVVRLCRGRTRVVVWYAGRGSAHGFFVGNGVGMTSAALLARLAPGRDDDPVLAVVVCDCCGTGAPSTPSGIEVNVTRNLSTIFDAAGRLAIGCANNPPSAFHRRDGVQPSTFLRDFFRLFHNTYENTLGLLELLGPGVVSSGVASYDKYIESEEPRTKGGRGSG